MTMIRKLFLILLSAVSLATAAQAREITDMAGRRVTVPDTIQRVYCASPPATYMMYAVDAKLLVGVNFKVREHEKRFLRPEFTNLPVAGGFFGQGKTPNMEIIMAAKPDIVLMWSSYGKQADDLYLEKLRKIGIPVVNIQLDNLQDYPAAFRFMGDLLNRKERAEKLAGYARKTLDSVAKAVAGIPEKERVSVYYAEGSDGLSTDREESWHTQVLKLSGGRNVHKGTTLDHYGMEKISLEQLMLYSPQVIITHERPFFGSLPNDKRWQGIRAVKEKRVYLIPRSPFNWFDRPPSFMRLLGLKWLANLLYPQRYPLNLADETKRFYRLFLGVELTDNDVREILGR